jgi:hypothetical protein
MVRDRDARTHARWTVWLTLSLGMYLFFTPEIWAVDGEAVSSQNSRFVGVCIVGVTVWTLGIPWLKGAEWIKVVLGCWLLVAPLVLGYGGTAAWNARGAGVLTLALVVLDNGPLASWARFRANFLRYRQRTITPGDIVEYRDSREPLTAEVLSGQIVERADQIHRTLRGKPSEIEVEMCALGCSACMDDLITLALLVSEEKAKSGPLRRMKLGAAYRCAVDSLSRTRQALGLYTVSVPSEERHQK